VVLALALPIGAMMPWKRARLGRLVKPLIPAAALAIVAFFFVWSVQSERTILGPVGFLLGVWLVGGAFTDLWSRLGRGEIAGRLGRLARLPRADWGRVAAHAGLGVTFMGISGLMAWQVEDIRVVQTNVPFEVADLEIELLDVREVQGPNYFSTTADIQVSRDGAVLAILEPEKRVYPVQAMPTTEAAIQNSFWRDIYVVIGDAQSDGGYAVRTFIKPFANWIWAGSLLMALGGLLSLSDRRYRVAAGAARQSRAQGVPAE